MFESKLQTAAFQESSVHSAVSRTRFAKNRADLETFCLCCLQSWAADMHDWIMRHSSGRSSVLTESIRTMLISSQSTAMSFP